MMYRPLSPPGDAAVIASFAANTDGEVANEFQLYFASEIYAS
jgi:hypothetical protein